MHGNKNLVLRMQQLHFSEINSGCQLFFDGELTVWIGDEMNGRLAEKRFDIKDELEDAVEWLHDTAIAMFPESGYAKTPVEIHSVDDDFEHFLAYSGNGKWSKNLLVKMKEAFKAAWCGD